MSDDLPPLHSRGPRLFRSDKLSDSALLLLAITATAASTHARTEGRETLLGIRAAEFAVNRECK